MTGPRGAQVEAVVRAFDDRAGAAGFMFLSVPATAPADDLDRAGVLGPRLSVAGPAIAGDTGDTADPHAPVLVGGTAWARLAHAQHHPAAPWKVRWRAPRTAPGPGGPTSVVEVGVAALGSADPDLDVEVIVLAHDLARGLGLRRLTVALGTVGERNGEAVAARERVEAGLGAAGVDFLVDHRLAGPPGAAGTVFEIQSEAVDPADAVLVAGSRHRNGPGVAPGVGFTAELDRLLRAARAEGLVPEPVAAADVFVVDLTGGAAARDLVVELRRDGLRADRAYDDRSMRAQMKAADRSGARVALIVGSDEADAGVVAVRPLRDDGETIQERVARAEAGDAARRHLS